jgi:hypothetical protein
VIVIGV